MQVRKFCHYLKIVVVSERTYPTGLFGILRRSKSLGDLANSLSSGKSAGLPKGGRIPKTKLDSSSTLDKGPLEHTGGLEGNLARRGSLDSDTLVPDRRSSMSSNRFHDPSKAVEIPPNGFVSERRIINLRNIKNIWNDFKINHPKASRLVKWTSWLLGAAATTGGSVVLSEEIRKLYTGSDLNITTEQVEKRIEIVTKEFEILLNDSMHEFERRPSPGIFDLYFNPVERVKRGDTSDFMFDFERIPIITKDKQVFYPKRNETYVGKHEKNIKSGITHFNDTKNFNEPEPSINTTLKTEISSPFPRNHHRTFCGNSKRNHNHLQSLRSFKCLNNCWSVDYNYARLDQYVLLLLWLQKQGKEIYT